MFRSYKLLKFLQLVHCCVNVVERSHTLQKYLERQCGLGWNLRKSSGLRTQDCDLRTSFIHHSQASSRLPSMLLAQSCVFEQTAVLGNQRAGSSDGPSWGPVPQSLANALGGLLAPADPPKGKFMNRNIRQISALFWTLLCHYWPTVHSPEGKISWEVQSI